MTVAAAVPASAQAQEKPVELGSVTVTDTAIDEKEAETSYKVSRSISATRTDTPLIDVPASVTVVPVKQIVEQAANSIGDAIRYVPGVFASQGESNRETLSFRGNSTTSSFFVDGIRDDVQTYRDLYNIDVMANLSTRLLSADPPRYPVESRRRREAGTVVLLVVVDEQGRVAAISIVASSGFDRLDKAALGAARHWSWAPTIIDGQPNQVRGLVRIPFKFSDTN